MNEFDTKREGVRIRIVETGEEFNSIQACANRLNANASQVRRVVRRERGLKTCHGYHIVLADSDIDIYNLKKEYRGRPGIKVRIVETGEEFNSISDCAKAIDGSSGIIHDIINSNRNRHTYKGLHFEKIE